MARQGQGIVTGEVVYANYGRLEDFDQLAAQHIDLHGKIVLCRYGSNFRGVKVYIAELRGAAGVLIYSGSAGRRLLQGDAYPRGRGGRRLPFNADQCNFSPNIPGTRRRRGGFNAGAARLGARAQ